MHSITRPTRQTLSATPSVEGSTLTALHSTPTLTARAALLGELQGLLHEHSLLLVVCVVHELMATRKGTVSVAKTVEHKQGKGSV